MAPGERVITPAELPFSFAPASPAVAGGGVRCVTMIALFGLRSRRASRFEPGLVRCVSPEEMPPRPPLDARHGCRYLGLEPNKNYVLKLFLRP